MPSSAGNDQTGPQLLLQVHEPRRGPNAARCRVTCLHLKLCRPMSRYSECRIALFLHRSGFTSKTLPYVHQPYVVKVSPTPRHVLRRAATRDLAIQCFSQPRCVFQCDLAPLNRPPVTNKPALNSSLLPVILRTSMRLHLSRLNAFVSRSRINRLHFTPLQVHELSRGF